MVVGALETDVDRVVLQALAEDVGERDLTTEGLVGPEETARAQLLLEEPGVVSGLAIAGRVFQALDRRVEIEPLALDGERLAAPAALARIDGPARAILTGERTALNFLGHLSGVATLTRSFVDAVEGTGAIILDTRKTTPGLRLLEKEAVRQGGGENHRLGLYDAILVKDNHLRRAGSVRAAVERLRATEPGRPIEVEADTLSQVAEALAAGADRILLDNMPLDDMRAAVALVAGRVPLEASGGVSLATVRDVAETGVDFISVGALTRSARALDVSLEVL
jgi:nicotinate-nucleotide pyrophosphorylase (carboxylating)